MTASTINPTEIFGRALDHCSEGLPRDVAAFLASLELPEEDAARMNELAEKSRQGVLSEDEEQQLEEYRRCGRLMEMFKLNRVARACCQAPAP